MHNQTKPSAMGWYNFMNVSTALKQNITSTTCSLAVNDVYCGDCHMLLKSVADNSIDVVLTSPPYFQQRKYTGVGIGMEHSVENYMDALMESFSEMIRIIKPSGSILYNLGDKICGKRGTLLIPYQFALVAAQKHPHLSLLNHITWVKTNPTPRQFTRRLVSSHEPFFHFVKSPDYYYCPEEFMAAPAVATTISSQGALPWSASGNSQGKKYFKKIADSELSKAEKAAAERDLKEVIREVQNGKFTGFRMKIRGLHAPAFGGNEGGRNNQMQRNGYTIIRMHGRPMKKDTLSFPVERVESCPHPAIFPLAMIRELIKLTCPPDGIVLDPYCGSGTTLVAAKKERRRYLGMDISPEYCEHAQQRLKAQQCK